VLRILVDTPDRESSEDIELADPAEQRFPRSAFVDPRVLARRSALAYRARIAHECPRLAWLGGKRSAALSIGHELLRRWFRATKKPWKASPRGLGVLVPARHSAAV
jgi:hypothetical protein